MTLTPALLANTNPRIIDILNANPGVWSAAVSGQVGAFPDLSAITAATLEADGILIKEGYFNSINNTLAQPFMAFGAPMARGARVPFHYGNLGSVELAKSVYPLTTTNITAATDIITANGHGIADRAPLSFHTNQGGTIPAGLTANQTYYANVVNSNSFSVASSPGGTNVDITSTGAGLFEVIEWQDGIEAESADDIAQAIGAGSDYLESGGLNYLYKIEDGALLHAARWARMELPTYTRTSVLQANKADEPIIIALAVSLLTKHASPALFEEWDAKAQRMLAAIIRDGSYQPGVADQNP